MKKGGFNQEGSEKPCGQKSTGFIFEALGGLKQRGACTKKIKKGQPGGKNQKKENDQNKP